MYQEKYASFFENCDLLFYECSWGEGPIDEEHNKDCKHSSVYEAVRVAEESQSKHLFLTHCRTEKQEAAYKKALTLSNISISFARFGESIDL